MTAVDVDGLADALVERLAVRLDVRPLFTTRTLAERLDLSERLVRQMVADGVIPSFKVGGSRRIEPAAVDRFLAEQKAAA